MPTPVCPETLPNINIVLENVRKEMAHNVENARLYWETWAQEKEARLVENRQAAALLHGAGFDIQTDLWGTPLEHVYIELGDGYSTKANRKALHDNLRLIAGTLGCHLDENGKEVTNGRKREVKVTLKAAKWPNVFVRFLTQLPRESTGRCRIEKTVRKASKAVSYDLVCEAGAEVKRA